MLLIQKFFIFMQKCSKNLSYAFLICISLEVNKIVWEINYSNIIRDAEASVAKNNP